jgi:stalled ribosome rescue protein Dom34
MALLFNFMKKIKKYLQKLLNLFGSKKENKVITIKVGDWVCVEKFTDHKYPETVRYFYQILKQEDLGYLYKYHSVRLATKEEIDFYKEWEWNRRH